MMSRTAAPTIIMQARTSSSRLPAKALLPLAGMPVAVLAARRATNTGLPLIVATSSDPSDDSLADTLTAAGFAVHRGSLADVLQRMTDAAADVPDNAPIIRLTADNVFPDGAILQDLAASFVKSDKLYMCLAADQLPYGLSAEIFTAGSLREADHEATAKFDREHVTPYIIRKFGIADFTPQDLSQRLGHLRATLDTYSDYRRLADLVRVIGADRFADASWRDLCDALATLPGMPTCKIPARYALGTAQLGLPYGIANRSGMPSDEEVAELLETAILYGLTRLDTARAYGSSEERLGRLLPSDARDRVQVHTKLDPMDDVAADTSATELVLRTEISVLRSAHALRRDTLDLVMLHRWPHRRLAKGAIWSRLLALKEGGIVAALGASVSTPTEALEALADPDVTHIQLPFNLLDRRWNEAGVPEAAKGRPDVCLEARSVLLQGLLAADDPSLWPAIDGIDATTIMTTLDDLVHELGRTDKADLCYAYAAAQPWIGGIVVGMETVAQLRDNAVRFARPPLSEAECATVRAALPAAPERLVNPALWAA